MSTVGVNLIVFLEPSTQHRLMKREREREREKGWQTSRLIHKAVHTFMVPKQKRRKKGNSGYAKQAGKSWKLDQ